MDLLDRFKKNASYRVKGYLVSAFIDKLLALGLFSKQEDLALLIGTSPGTLSRICDRNNQFYQKMFSFDLIERVAKFMEIAPQDLILDPNEPLEIDFDQILKLLEQRGSHELVVLSQSARNHGPKKRQDIAAGMERLCGEAHEVTSRLQSLLGRVIDGKEKGLQYEHLTLDLSRLHELDDMLHKSTLTGNTENKLFSGHLEIGDICIRYCRITLRELHPDLQDRRAAQALLDKIETYFIPAFAYHKKVIKALRCKDMPVDSLREPLWKHLAELACLVNPAYTAGQIFCEGQTL